MLATKSVRSYSLTIGSWSSNDGKGNENVTVIIASSSHPLLLTEHAANGLVEAPFK